MIKRAPDFVIGPPESPYLLRWWIIPRNRFFNIYLHHMLRDDDDRALHDHPWINLSIILRGGYREIVRGKHGGLLAKLRRPGAFVLRMPSFAHRLELIRLPGGYNYSWSLFITGPRIREWGFHCPKGWVLWKDFVDETSTGNIGRGCGEKS